MSERINIAIDGPSGVGKSTAAKALAERLGICCLDTGAMYRAYALAMLRRGVSLDDARAIAAEVGAAAISVVINGTTQRVYIDDDDVSDAIRTPQVSEGSSKVAVVSEVRAYMQRIQREIAAHNDVILDGRDIGVKVLPNARPKFFLTASAEVRAKRRYNEMPASERPPFAELLTAIAERDRRDAEREADPLRPAADAVIIDTSDMGLGEMIGVMYNEIIKTIKTIKTREVQP